MIPSTREDYYMLACDEGWIAKQKKAQKVSPDARKIWRERRVRPRLRFSEHSFEVVVSPPVEHN
eukprot:scaffold363_cov56-Cylindrotheca_fusiformis.AAC.20